MTKGYFKELNKIRNSTYFEAINNHTKYCASCGHNYNMKGSKHAHLPFCEKCRVEIIKKEFGTIEK